jgi:hypothetical protein
MFEDLDEEHVDVTPDSPDRAIAWAIWSRGEDTVVTPDEAWAILHERYPDDARFLLLNAYTELNETRRTSERVLKVAVVVGAKGGEKPGAGGGVWTPSYFLKKVERIVAGATDALYPQLRDLVVFGGAVLAGAKDEDANTLALIRAKIRYEGENEPKRDERDRAGLRLRRFEREVLKELDERTQDGKALGVRAPAAQGAATNDWASAMADKDKPRRRYAADARFERGELVEHPKFGVGVVTGTEPGKAVILFESGTRKLVAGTG